MGGKSSGKKNVSTNAFPCWEREHSFQERKKKRKKKRDV